MPSKSAINKVLGIGELRHPGVLYGYCPHCNSLITTLQVDESTCYTCEKPVVWDEE